MSSVNQQLSLSQTPRDACHWSVTNLHKLSDQYHWALWNTHHIKLTFVTPTNKLSSFLLIFELFSLIFYWKYSIFLHETPHTWNVTRHIFWRHWRMTSKVRKRTSRNTKKLKLKTQIYLIWLESVFEKKTMVKSVIYLLFSYQTGCIMWHSRLKVYIWTIVFLVRGVLIGCHNQ
jgi:hypothetical protein